MQDNQIGQNESEKRGEGRIGELAKKAVTSSVSALLSSEEGIRSLIGTLVPREVGSYIGKELAVLRSEILKAIVAELSRYLATVDITKELKGLLDGLSFDIHVKVNVSQREESPKSANCPKKPRESVRSARKS